MRNYFLVCNINRQKINNKYQYIFKLTTINQEVLLFFFGGSSISGYNNDIRG